MGVYYDSRTKGYYVRLTVNGKQHYLYKDELGRPFKFQKTAKVAEAAFALQCTNESAREQGDKSAQILCDDLFEPFFNSLHQTLKESSVYVRKKHFIHHLQKYFVGVPVKTLTNQDLETMNTKVNQDPKHGNIGNVVATARTWIKYIQKYNPTLLPDKFFEFRDSGPVEKHVYHVWTRDEEKAFLSNIKDPKYKLLFTLLCDYGFRITECMALKYSDIDWKHKTLTVNRIVCNKTLNGGQVFMSPKTKKSNRTLPLLPEVEEQLDHHGYGFIFPSEVGEKGEVIGQTPIRLAAVKYAKLAHLKPIKLHEFRHSCASNMLKAGLPVRVVADWLGDVAKEHRCSDGGAKQV
jgi:integrase